MRIEPVALTVANDAQDRVVKKSLARVPHETATQPEAAASQPSTPTIPPETTLKLKRQPDDVKNTVYQLVDKSTGDVVRQVPSQQVLNVADSIEQLLQQEIRKPKIDAKL